MGLMKALYRTAFNDAKKKNAPVNIPMDYYRARNRNYFVIYLYDENGVTYIYRDIIKEKIYVNKIPCSDGDKVIEIDINQLKNYSVEILHYYGELVLKYMSFQEYFYKKYTLEKYFLLLNERFVNFLYSKRSFQRQTRVSILRKVVESEIDNSNGISIHYILSEIYGKRWVLHPNHKALYDYYELMLLAFVESGELSKDNFTYKATPRALNTLNRYDEEDGRHKGVIKIQKWMVVATILSAVAMFGQLYKLHYPSSPITEENVIEIKLPRLIFN